MARAPSGRRARTDRRSCYIGLPGMSGYEVAAALRDAGGRPTKLIAVTGYARPHDVRSAMEAGFDAHVAKPFDAQELERLISDGSDPGGPRGR